MPAMVTVLCGAQVTPSGEIEVTKVSPVRWSLSHLLAPPRLAEVRSGALLPPRIVLS